MHNTSQLSEMRTPRYSVKRTGFCSPASTWTVQNSLDNVGAGRPLAQDCPAPPIDSPTGHYTNTGTHSSSLWLITPFLLLYSKGELNGTSTHCHAYRKYTGNL